MANILKQIKVGNTTYNIEPYTVYVPITDLGNTTFKVTRGASQSTKNTGYWAGMLRSDQTGSPVLPSSKRWWHVISMDWSGTDSNNWISQLALPTQDGGGVPHYRRNDGDGGVSIDNSTWHAFITDENIGSQYVNYANSAGTATNLVSFTHNYHRPVADGGDGKQWMRIANIVDNDIANGSRWYAKAVDIEFYNNGYGSAGGYVYMGHVSICVPVHNHGTFAKESVTIKWRDCKPDIWSPDHIKAVKNTNNVEIFMLNDIWDTGIIGVIVRNQGIDVSSSTTLYTPTEFSNYISGKATATGVLDSNVIVGKANYANSAGSANSANSVAWGNVSGKPSSFNPASHTHTSLKSNTDNRNTNTTPNDYNGVLNIAGLKDNSKIGLDTNIYGTYSCLIGVRGWQDSSGGDSHEIALTGNGQIMHRNGSTTSWGSWDKIAHTSYIDTYFPRAKVGNDSPYSNVYTSFIGGVSDGPRGTGWEFLYRAEHRNGSGDGPNYIMEIVSNLTSDSSIYWRKKTGGSFTSFREIIDSNNIGSQSVNFANGAEIANYANSAGSANSVAWGNITDKPSTFPTTVDSSLSSSSNNPVRNSTIFSAFSETAGFDHEYYAYGDNGSWRLREYHAKGNSLDIRYGKFPISAQEKTYSVSFSKDFSGSNYAIVCGIYRDNRNSWFWSPLVTSRSTKGFNVYVRGNGGLDNSGTLFYIAIKSN